MKEVAERTERLVAAGLAEGFARVGVAAADRLDPESAQLDAWLEAGRQGQMAWMKATAEVRKDPRHPGMLASARSVVVLAAPHSRRPVYEGPAPARVAKYALGRDYHNVLTKKAKRVAQVLEEEGFVSRVAVDSKPVFERAWAERAGVGFVGKNCCLIVPGLGSYVFLACLVTDAPLRASTPIERRCGSCTLCLDACPTRAFESPRTLDARKCVSYLTIEHRGPIPESEREGVGEWLFGCDVCQDVCPYNQGAAQSDASIEAFEPGARWDGVELEDFLEMDETVFDAWARGSPLKRAKREGLARNASIVLGNRGDAKSLPVLAATRDGHESEVVRESAGWAYERLSRRLKSVG
jgi:epoxyqueuosine reductase